MSRRTGLARLAPLLLAACLAPLVAPGALAQELKVKLPPKPFGELPPPPPPDYSQPRYWAALPDRADAADVVPDNDPFGDRQASAPVDVFYIHPTTFNQASWNQPLDDARTNDWTDESVIARQAAVFNACCRVYAPRYRQAASAAVYAPPEMKAMGAYEFAWGDVRDAFRYYLKHYNKGRPFIVAGHSQGAAHIERWLKEFGADRALARRLVAAYPIGIGYTVGQLARLPGGRGACRTPTETGCIVTWNAFASDATPQAFIASTQARYEKATGTRDGQEIVCINPLTFDAARPVAPAAWNLGALPARAGVGLEAARQAGTGLAATEAGRLGARCADGALVVDALPAQGYAIVPLPGGSLHFNDYDLFFQNIRVNAVVRSEAFLSQGRQARR